MIEAEGECGCQFRIMHEPCEYHRMAIEAGEERAHIGIEFRDKHSDWPANRHWVGLERVQRNHLGLDDEPMAFDEGTLADMLQSIADADPLGQAAFVLRALANAFRDQDDDHRLRLHQKRRGKWPSPSERLERHRLHAAWILRLHRLQRDGWPTDAAVHRIAETTGNSVSRVYGGIAEERAWQELVRSFPNFPDETSKLNARESLRSPDDEF